MYNNDIVTSIGRGNGTMLVLLDVLAALNTIDHDNLYCILKEICHIFWLKIQDIILYQILMLAYKSFYNIAPSYFCQRQLINKKEVM